MLKRLLLNKDNLGKAANPLPTTLASCSRKFPIQNHFKQAEAKWREREGERDRVGVGEVEGEREAGERKRGRRKKYQETAETSSTFTLSL